MLPIVMALGILVSVSSKSFTLLAVTVISPRTSPAREWGATSGEPDCAARQDGLSCRKDILTRQKRGSDWLA